MAKVFIFSALSNLSMLLQTLTRGKAVGSDGMGNKYYRGKGRKGSSQSERRWVIYKNEIEASLVPPEWHGWLHHQTDVVPQSNSPYRQPWQKSWQRNMTGTTGAYLPPGHTLKGSHRDAATGDYVAWQPPK